MGVVSQTTASQGVAKLIPPWVHEYFIKNMQTKKLEAKGQAARGWAVRFPENNNF